MMTQETVSSCRNELGRGSKFRDELDSIAIVGSVFPGRDTEPTVSVGFHQYCPRSLPETAPSTGRGYGRNASALCTGRALGGPLFIGVIAATLLFWALAASLGLGALELLLSSIMGS